MPLTWATLPPSSGKAPTPLDWSQKSTPERFEGIDAAAAVGRSDVVWLVAALRKYSCTKKKKGCKRVR